jgi:pimeloyl-ACP methyl ester carboxylesterase
MKTQKFSWESPQLPAEDHFNLKAKSAPPCMTLFAQGERPLWILVHGWLGGSRLMDEVFWPLCDLYRTHDMALYTLPGHGPRSSPSYSLLPTFPSRNPLRNVLGLLAAVTELRQLTAALRAQGYRKIGIAGTSLGVQVVALLATVEDCAERYLFDRPLVELSDPVRRLSLQGTEEFAALAEALESFYRPIRPLCRRSCVEKDRIDVLLAEQDHVAGRSSGERLAQHFKVDPITFPTGHVWSLGREAVIVEIMRKLRETAGPV